MKPSKSYQPKHVTEKKKPVIEPFFEKQADEQMNYGQWIHMMPVCGEDVVWCLAKVRNVI